MHSFDDVQRYRLEEEVHAVYFIHFYCFVKCETDVPIMIVPLRVF